LQACTLATELRKADTSQAEAEADAARLKAEKVAAAEELNAAAAVVKKLTKQAGAVKTSSRLSWRC